MTATQEALEGIGEPVVFDAEDSRRLAREGMAAAERVALAGALDQAVATAARRHRELTADEVWEALGRIPNAHGLASGLGPAMHRAVAAGTIESTGAYRPSSRPKAHRKPLPVWRSLVWAP